MRIIIRILLLFVTCSVAPVFGAGSLSNNSDRDKYVQWIEIVHKSHSENKESDAHIFTVLAENFYRKYRESSDPFYLISALHEAGRALRGEIIDRLTEEEYNSVSDAIQKMHYQNIPANYFQIREFGPADIYSFIGYNMSEEITKDALALLNHWYDFLEQSYAEDPVMASFKAQALSAGYGKLGEYDKVADLSI